MQIKGLYISNYNILLFYLIISVFGCKTNGEHKDSLQVVKYGNFDSAAVVTAHPIASEIGLSILKKGGNAVDAAIAVQFALAVCYPQAGNIGGGGFLVYRTAEGENYCLDFREMAPSQSTDNMYLDSIGEVINRKSVFGHLSAGVPGTVDGMDEMFRKFSKLKDWPLLIQPAIDLATNGFPISENEANNLNKYSNEFLANNQYKTAFQNETKWSKGDLLIQPDLAKVLKTIRDHKRDGFYDGETAKLIVNDMKNNGGLITHEDLKSYHSVWRNPIVCKYREYEILSMPPPSSGGIALCQCLQTINEFGIQKLAFQSAAHVHFITEIERRVYADRAKHLGDPDYYNVPVDTLLSKHYLTNRFMDFNPRKASKSEEINAGTIKESEETTHFSIIDQFGNALSLTTTLNSAYGSFSVVEGAGFILNNEMDDFSIKPGSPNIYGLIGGEANKIEPGKRMLSSMTPTVVYKDGKCKLIVGSPGGSTIITTVLQIIVNALDYNMTIDSAVQMPRFHHQWLPDLIYTEKNAINIQQRKILNSIGHKIEDREPIGRVEAIFINNNGKIHAASDTRGDDHVSGY